MSSESSPKMCIVKENSAPTIFVLKETNLLIACSLYTLFEVTTRAGDTEPSG